MKRSRFRKWAKWVGLGGCVVIVAAWVSTIWWAFGGSFNHRGRNLGFLAQPSHGLRKWLAESALADTGTRMAVAKPL